MPCHVSLEKYLCCPLHDYCAFWLKDEKLTEPTALRLPYLAQGASQAIEDTGVLVTALALAPSVPIALEVYSLIRKPRMTLMHELVAITQKNLHLNGKEDLIKRDEEMKALRETSVGKEAETRAKHPDRWADRECQDFMYGVDVMKICVEQWDELSTQAEKNLMAESGIIPRASSLEGVPNTGQILEKTEPPSEISQPRKRARSPGDITSMDDHSLRKSPRKLRNGEMGGSKSNDLSLNHEVARKIKPDRGVLVSSKSDEPLRGLLSANAPLLHNIEAGKM